MNHESIIFQLQGDRAVLQSDQASTSRQVDNTYFMIFTTILTFYALTADDLRTTFSRIQMAGEKRVKGGQNDRPGSLGSKFVPWLNLPKPQWLGWRKLDIGDTKAVKKLPTSHLVDHAGSSAPKSLQTSFSTSLVSYAAQPRCEWGLWHGTTKIYHRDDSFHRDWYGCFRK